MCSWFWGDPVGVCSSWGDPVGVCWSEQVLRGEGSVLAQPCGSSRGVVLHGRGGGIWSTADGIGQAVGVGVGVAFKGTSLLGETWKRPTIITGFGSAREIARESESEKETLKNTFEHIQISNSDIQQSINQWVQKQNAQSAPLAFSQSY